MAEQDLDRNEAATPFKLQKARDRGQVAKSADATSAMVFTAAVVYLNWHGWEMLLSQLRLDQTLLLRAGSMRLEAGNVSTLTVLVAQLLQGSFVLLAPFLATLMLTAIVANLLQTGFILSADPVKPDFQRINPVSGLKKIFSMRTLFDAARACIKLALLLFVTWVALKELLPQFFGLASTSPAGHARLLLDDFASLGLKMTLALGLIALLDLLYTRYEFAKTMRMSKRDITDEAKHRDGDPRIRARMRELCREMAKRAKAVGQTRNADVLITNPTHVAIALRYVHGEMDSPELLAKGTGHVAAVMRSIAAQHRIPVVQSPALARRLFSELPVGRSVPPELYAQVARIVVWVFAMRERHQGAQA